MTVSSVAIMNSDRIGNDGNFGIFCLTLSGCGFVRKCLQSTIPTDTVERLYMNSLLYRV